jgi:hypothetical protein
MKFQNSLLFFFTLQTASYLFNPSSVTFWFYHLTKSFVNRCFNISIPISSYFVKWASPLGIDLRSLIKESSVWSNIFVSWYFIKFKKSISGNSSS